MITAVARSLTRLRHLDLSDCSLDFGSTDLMLALAQLTQLTWLNIAQGWGGQLFSVGALMQLTGLSNLKDVVCNRSPETTEEVLRVFWAAVREQQ
jgi:hypothetical protein